MTHSPQDQELARLLKQEAYQATENKWFTPRVVNKLPPRRSLGSGVAAIVCYVTAIVVCCLSWMWWMRSGFTVITVRDIAYFVSLAAITGLVVMSPLVALLRRT